VDLVNVGKQMFMRKCILRRETLPILPCDCTACEWYINDPIYNNCFWVLAHIFEINPGNKMSFDVIAILEGVTINEIITIYENAMNKLRKESRNIMKSDNFDNIS